MAKRTANTSAAPSPELGVTGLRRWGGFVREEFLPQLQGRRGMRIYREMRDNSPVIGACLGAIEMLIRQVGWYVDPASSSTEDLATAAFVDQCRSDMSHSWADFLSEVISMFTFGFSYFELVYKRRLGDGNDPRMSSHFNDGRIGWRKIPIRAQESLFEWVFDDEGGIQGMVQSAAPKFSPTLIPIEKALLFRAKSEKNSPEGRSILRSSYFPWYFSKKISELEGIGISRDLAGLPVFWIPVECMLDGANEEHKATRAMAEEIVQTVSRDEQEGLVLPLAYDQGNPPQPRFKFELLNSGGKRSFDTDAIINRYDRRIAMSLMYDLVMMGQPNTTMYKGKSMPEFFAVSLGGWVDAIRDVINANAIPRLLRLNGMPTDRMPKLCHREVVAPDLAALGDYIMKLATVKMPLFDKDWNFLRRQAGLDDLPTDPAERAKAIIYSPAAAASTTAAPKDDNEPDDAAATARGRRWMRGELAELSGVVSEMKTFIEAHARQIETTPEALLEAVTAEATPAPTTNVSTTVSVPDNSEALALVAQALERSTASMAVVTQRLDGLEAQIEKALAPPVPAPDPTEGLARMGEGIGKGIAESGASMARGMVEAAAAAPAPAPISIDARTTVTAADQSAGLERMGAEISKGVVAAGAVTAQAIEAAAAAQDGPRDVNILSLPDRRQSLERDGDGKMSGSVERDEPEKE